MIEVILWPALFKIKGEVNPHCDKCILENIHNSKRWECIESMQNILVTWEM